jgi:hypothetical protein
LRLNKINKSLATLTKRRREKTQINKIRDEKVDITTNTNEIQRLMREHFVIVITYVNVTMYPPVEL